jgi:hypothetical protein
MVGTDTLLDDASLDPSSGSDSSRALLNTGGETQSMLMGLTVQAPKPALSPDQIQPFNALDAMSENVFDDGDKSDPRAVNTMGEAVAQAEADGWSPNIPTVTTPRPQASWSPAAPADSSSDPAAQWEAVSKAWQNPSQGAATAQDVLSRWKAAYGWTTNKAAAPARCSSLVTMELNYLSPPLARGPGVGLFIA